MTGPLLIRYLRSRLGVVPAFYANTFLILVLTGLVLSYRTSPCGSMRLARSCSPRRS